MVVEGETGGSAPRVDAQFSVDRCQMGAHRAAADHELLCNLDIAQSIRDQAQHFHFSPRKGVAVDGGGSKRRGWDDDFWLGS